MPIIDGFRATKIIRSGEEFENEAVSENIINKSLSFAHNSCGLSAKEKAIDCVG